MKHYGLERIVIDTPINLIDPSLSGLTIPPTHVPPGVLKLYVKEVSNEYVLCIMDEDLNEFCTDSATGFATPHNILSASHTDALVGTVVRGDLIVGNSTPKWSRFAKGTALQILRMNAGGTDPEWAAAATAGHEIRENGSAQTVRAGLNFVDTDAGAGLVTDDAGGNETELNLQLYALLTGRSGGQSLLGGTAASNNLTLQSTSNATRGSVIVNDLLDISIVAAGSPRMKILATTDTPVVAFTGGGSAPTTAPAGYMEVDVGGVSRYIPFWA